MATTIKVNGATISINDKSQESTHKSAAEIINGGSRAYAIGHNIGTAAQLAAKGAGKAAAKNLGTYVVSELVNAGLGTILTTAVSCGTFKNGTDIFNSQKCKNKINKFKNKYNCKDVSASDVKNDPKAKTKSGFWNWVFAGNVSGKKVTKIPKHDIAVKQINGVTVAVTTLDPFYGSVDLRQLAGQKVIIVTGFYRKDNGSIGSKNLCRGYLSKGGIVNKSGESLISEQERYLSLESLMEPIIENIKEKALESFFGLNDDE
jgi:hypothetical protein